MNLQFVEFVCEPDVFSLKSLSIWYVECRLKLLATITRISEVLVRKCRMTILALLSSYEFYEKMCKHQINAMVLLLCYLYFLRISIISHEILSCLYEIIKKNQVKKKFCVFVRVEMRRWRDIDALTSVRSQLENYMTILRHKSTLWSTTNPSSRLYVTWK